MKSRFSYLRVWAFLFQIFGGFVAAFCDPPVHGPKTTSSDKDAPKDASCGDEQDPIEPMNRAFFSLNTFLDELILEPITELYALTVPKSADSSLESCLKNLREPLTFVNSLLQGNPQSAGRALQRFAINSTLGFGGLFNPAQDIGGISREYLGFSDTMKAWGIQGGFYVVMPLYGPTDTRGVGGFIVDTLTDPFSLFLHTRKKDDLELGRRGAYAVTQREHYLKEFGILKSTSRDLYARVRSIYQQGQKPPLEEDLSGPTLILEEE